MQTIFNAVKLEEISRCGLIYGNLTLVAFDALSF